MLSAKKRNPKSPSREGETPAERLKRKRRDATQASRENAAQREFEKLIKTKILFLLPDHGHDQPEVILPKSTGKLPDYYRACCDEGADTFDPYTNYDCLQMNNFLEPSQQYGQATLDGKDLPVYFNVQDDWDTIEENMDLDYIHTEGWEPFQPNMEDLRDNEPMKVTYLNHIVGLCIKYRIDLLLQNQETSRTCS